jgi:hypothetical protein
VEPPPPPDSPLAQSVLLALDQRPSALPLPPRALLLVALVLDLTRHPMSARGVAFLKDWLARNMGGPEQDSDPVKAARLAKRLVADAAVKEITVAEMNLEGYDIEKYTLEAMTAPIE